MMSDVEVESGVDTILEEELYKLKGRASNNRYIFHQQVAWQISQLNGTHLSPEEAETYLENILKICQFINLHSYEVPAHIRFAIIRLNSHFNTEILKNGQFLLNELPWFRALHLFATELHNRLKQVNKKSLSEVFREISLQSSFYENAIDQKGFLIMIDQLKTYYFSLTGESESMSGLDTSEA